MARLPETSEVVALLDAVDVRDYRLVCTPEGRVEAVLALTPDALDGAQAAMDWSGLGCEVSAQTSGRTH